LPWVRGAIAYAYTAKEMPDTESSSRRFSILLALASAVLFGLAAPAAKVLITETDPWLVAGLLYLGSGLVLTCVVVMQRGSGRTRPREASLTRRDWPWLGGAILTGGVVGPVFLMFGLSWGSASDTALLLNLEGVFTALLAWVVFREHVDARVAAGMAAITLGAVVLAWSPSAGFRLTWSSLAVAGACLAWAIDNNLTRKVSSSDPVQIVALKGLIAGAVNIAIAMRLGARLPGVTTLAATSAVGALGYGVSLILFIVALRHLGAGRASAYFSIAPFVGALGGVLALGEPVTGRMLAAAALMAIGVGLHVSERHEHDHAHAPLQHDHRHSHDEHHKHVHAAGTPVGEPHSHPHAHETLRHSHPHFPDIHHRHHH
jgi:drug/metabolite transporter (DMT)-like permease